jgi:ABC-type polysaccharide/polyol phosphate export permease
MLRKYKPLMKELVVRDLKVKYRRSFLGYLWSLLNPLLMMCVMTVVFAHIFRFSQENYPVYVIIGQTCWNFFFESTTWALDSILMNSALIKKVYIPKIIFPISRVLSSFVNMLFSLGAILIVMLFTHVKFTWALCMLPFVLLCLFLFCLGVGMILASMTVYFRDMLHLYTVLTTAWMYMTPIFWTVDIIPEHYIWILKLNPLYHYVTYFRSLVLDGVVPDLHQHLVCLGASLIVLAIGDLVFTRLQKNFILYI